MKKAVFSILVICGLQTALDAQTNLPSASTNTNGPAGSVAPTVVARTANSRVWARIGRQTNASGQVSLATNKAYTELATGLCVKGPDGSWTDAAPVLAPDNVLGGASASGTRHRVHFAINANTAGGAIHLVSPDGNVFDSRVYGLSYWDSASGKSVLLAPLQDSQGALASSNRVVYVDAFKGLKADLEYIFTKAGLEQNVILREQPPTPESLGLAAASTRLQALTEFFSPPVPQKRSLVVQGIKEDYLLNFGMMAIGMGKAFWFFRNFPVFSDWSF
jgi:hypothetical protein